MVISDTGAHPPWYGLRPGNTGQIGWMSLILSIHLPLHYNVDLFMKGKHIHTLNQRICGTQYCVYKKKKSDFFPKVSVLDLATNSKGRKYMWNKTRAEKYKIGTAKLEQQAFRLRGLSTKVAKLNITKRRTRLFRHTHTQNPDNPNSYHANLHRISFKH